MLDVVVHAYDPSTVQAEAGESYVKDPPGLQNKYQANPGSRVTQNEEQGYSSEIEHFLAYIYIYVQSPVPSTKTKARQGWGWRCN